MLAYNPCTGEVRTIDAKSELRADEDVYHGGGAISMTARDHFAGVALSGYFANDNCLHRVDPQDVAGYCYSVADAMLLARRGA